MKWFSRKLFVFLVSCLALVFGYITEDTWLIIAGIYIGVQTLLDAKINFNKTSNND